LQLPVEGFINLLLLVRIKPPPLGARVPGLDGSSDGTM